MTRRAPDDRDLLVAPLEAFGLPVTWYESKTTTAYRFHYEGDHRIMQQKSVGQPWAAAQAAVEREGPAGAGPRPSCGQSSITWAAVERGS